MNHMVQKTFLAMLLVIGIVGALGGSETVIVAVVLGTIVLFTVCYAVGASVLSVTWVGLSSAVHGLLMILTWVFTKPKPSARFMGWFEKWLLFKRGDRGFLVDGYNKRLTEQLSFKSVLAVAGMGQGKSSVMVMPNLYTLDNCSIVVSDTSGEIYTQTSGYLAEKGFDILVLNLTDTSVGVTYNPLEGADGFTEVAQVANLIVRSSLQAADDQFWSAGAERLIRILITCLRNRGVAEHRNLANVHHLLNNFDSHLPDGGRIDSFIAESTGDDPLTFNDYRGFLAGNERTMLSFISSATTALSALGNPEIAGLTQTSSFDFGSLRQRKTVLYIVAREAELRFYSFLLNLFYTQLFETLLSNIDSNKLPVYLLLDEFGHLTIPNFDIYATTARKHNVALFALTQSLGQLDSRYGPNGTRTIMDSFGTSIYLPGTGLDTAKALERRLGKVQKPLEQGDQIIYREENLLNESEIIQMADNEALIIHTNRRPIRLRTKPYYRQKSMVRKSKIPPHPLQKGDRKPVSLVSLDTNQNEQEEQHPA